MLSQGIGCINLISTNFKKILNIEILLLYLSMKKKLDIVQIIALLFIAIISAVVFYKTFSLKVEVSSFIIFSACLIMAVNKIVILKENGTANTKRTL